MQVMNFLAGYYSRILHIINTINNFRPRGENFASPLVSLRCGCWKPVDREGAETGPMSGCLFCQLGSSAHFHPYCLEVKENLSENLSRLQGGDLECSRPF